uniref:Gag-Pol polyprotein n=1 Tax=Tanacetum cinerariifolium TaxID=118510 RepID=A0A699HUP1_TANCI|nr:hypothetical protein [Tanacetum cinerariifolium]
MQTQTSNTLYNAIMEAGSKDRPPMLASDKEVPISEGSYVTTTETYMETYKNVSQNICDQLNVEAEAVQIILTGIDNDIYSTVDACLNACEMWKAIKRNRGKVIINSLQPIYDEEPSMVAKDDEMSKDKDIDKLMALISLSFKKIYKPTNNNLQTSSNTSRANQDNFPRINRSTGHVARECQKPKRAKDATYHREKMLLYQELEAHYMYMAQVQEVSPDATDSGPIFDAEPLQNLSNDDQYNVFAIETGSESRPHMLNKENYVPWSSRLLRYAKSRPNGKLIHNSIINGPHVRRMIPEPRNANCDVTVTETFHVQTDDEFTDKEFKQIEADDQAIQTILIGLPEDIYAAVDSCETAQEIWLRIQQMMKGSNIGIQEKKTKLFNEWERFTSNEGESIESYYHRFLKLMNDLKRNKHFPEKIASNLKFLNNLQPEWSRHVTIVHQTKDLHTADYTQLYDFLKYNQKERISSNPRNRQIAQSGMNMGQDRQMQMVGGNGGNQFRQYAGNLTGEWKSESDWDGNLVAARAEGNAAG